MINLHAGDKVLVQSGAGGVGTALIQYAKYKQCEIFSTAGSETKLDYLRSLGVHHPINYTTHDFETEIMSITDGKGVDAIFDAVGGASIKKDFVHWHPEEELFAMVLLLSAIKIFLVKSAPCWVLAFTIRYNL
jgi:NADPH:quinone reductase-like Zn-dependent oxidoreductase